MISKTPCALHELPETYIPVFTVDAKKPKTAVWLNLVGSLLSVGLIVLFLCLRPETIQDVISEEIESLGLVWLFFFVGEIIYLVLHELTHGIVYKYFTKEKLTFGISLTCAYCGVPQVYVNGKTAFLSLIAPLSVFTVLLLPPIFLLDGVFSLLFILYFSLHIGGCIGDIYDTLLFLFKFHLFSGTDVWMRDTGPLQTFYLPKE